MRVSVCFSLFLIMAAFLICFPAGDASAEELTLEDVLSEALEKNPKMHLERARAEALNYRVPRVQSLPDPVISVGYQNEGYEKYSYGEAPDAQWMFTLSQLFPFPGKLPLKGHIAGKEAESAKKTYDFVRLNTIAKVKETFFDLFLAYKNLDLLSEKYELFLQIEEAALARYSAGKGSQQEVITAQSEKYMLLERQEIYRQSIDSLEARLNALIGRRADAALGRPSEPVPTVFPHGLVELLALADARSPEIQAGEKMVAAADKGISLAKKGYYPDITLTGGLMERRNYQDMWSITTAINIPIFYKTKQRKRVSEAQAEHAMSVNALESLRLRISSSVREKYASVRAAGKLMEIYRGGLIPKTTQEFESVRSGYETGKVDAFAAITRLKSLVDSEMMYWGQLVEREKGIARLEALTGMADTE
jgi:outer membrane protein TolC